MSPIKKIQKRDGRIVDFDQDRITQAIWKAAQAVGGSVPAGRARPVPAYRHSGEGDRSASRHRLAQGVHR